MGLAENSEIVEMLETTVSNWQNQVLQAIEDQLKAERQSLGPLAEIEFWRERNASFVTLLEQLKGRVLYRFITNSPTFEIGLIKWYEIP